VAVPEVSESWSAAVNIVTLGKTADEGGTRSHTVQFGGARAMPYLGDVETRGLRPLVAMDVLDLVPEDWPAVLKEAFSDVIGKPAEWAKKCVEEFGADLVCVKLDGIHPDKGDRSAQDAVDVVKSVLEAVGVPLIIWGSGNDAKDNEVMPKVSEAVRGENCLLASATKDNYKTLVAVCLADGHCLVTEAPLDINIAKQVNILVSDMGFPLERIVMFQTTGALGYGVEYAYSIQERQRLAALAGDKLMAMPAICDVGSESWRHKEAKAPAAEFPAWGSEEERGPLWEAMTAITLLQAGSDLIRLRHPRAVSIVRDFINKIWS